MYYEFVVNTLCNWDCWFCTFPKYKRDVTVTHQQLDSFDWMFDIINKIFQKENDVILLQGGEIGLVNDLSILEHLFKKFNHKVVIDTNGKFLERNYHNIFKDYIKEVYYHVVPDPKYVTKIIKYQSDVPIQYGVVGEPKDLYTFVKDNSEVYFDYVDIETQDNKFSYADHVEEIRSLFSLDNVNHKRINEILDRVNYNLEQVRKLCAKKNSSMVINLPEERLSLCMTKANHFGIKLTKDNLIQILLSNPIKQESEFCNICVRSCFANYNLNKIKYFSKVLLKGL